MKCILFTGATGGLGRLCVEALSKLGYAVFAAGTNKVILEELGRFSNVIPVETDVTSAESIKSARKAVLAHTSRLHAVINFAGMASFCSMVEGECVNIAERLINVNVMGTVRVNRAFFGRIMFSRPVPLSHRTRAFLIQYMPTCRQILRPLVYCIIEI